MATVSQRLIRASSAFRSGRGLSARLHRLVAQAAYVTGAEAALLVLCVSSAARLPFPTERLFLASRLGIADSGATQVGRVLEEISRGTGVKAACPPGTQQLEALAQRTATAAGVPYHRMFPLDGDEFWGLLILAGTQNPSLYEGDLSVAAPVVQDLNLALEVAVEALALSEAREEEIKALHEIGKEISALGSLDRVLALICRKSAELLGVEISYVGLRDKRDKIIRMRMTYGISPSWRYRMWMRFGEGVGGTVAQTRRPLLIENYETFDHPTREDIRSMVIEEGIKAVVAVPMIIGDEVTGVLYGADRRPAHFTERDARLLQGMADQAAIAIANSELYESERREVEVHDRLTEVVLRDGDYWSIARELRRLVENPTALFDSHLGLLACDPDAEDLVGSLSRLRDQIAGNDRLAENLAAGPRRRKQAVHVPAFPEHGMEVSRVIAPAVSGEEILGFVHILEVDRPLEPQDIRIAERAGVILALRRMRERVEAEVAQRMRGELLDDLLTDNPVIMESAVRRAPHLGYDLEGQHVVLVADVRPQKDRGSRRAWSEPSSLASPQRLFHFVRRAVEAGDLESLCDVKAERVVAIVRCPETVDANTEFVPLIRRRLLAELPPNLAGAPLAIGVGTVVSESAELPRSYEEALMALKASLEYPSGTPVVSYEELGIVGLLFDPSHPARLTRFVRDRIGVLLEYDRKKNSELAETLRCYLDLACNKVETARRLNVHLSTLKYRLERAQDILGLDLEDPDTRFELHVALRASAVERLLGSSS
ncbi:MAG: helix-turn-helix domain-containing protein [Thermoleophilia bacterium]